MKRRHILSPSGCVHADNPEEPAQQTLCNQFSSYYWLSTDKPVTCKSCLRALPVEEVTKCVRDANKYYRAYKAELRRFNEGLSFKCKFRRRDCCAHKSNLDNCYFTVCPL